MKIAAFILLLSTTSLMAQSYQSSDYKVSLLELYTSEGCSSCPPAEEWLSRIYRQGYRHGSVIPLALHVTYWDYLGWKDRFASKLYDQRQRKMVNAEGGRTVYTPQFFLNAQTVRTVSKLKNTIDKISTQRAEVRIDADVKASPYEVIVDVQLQRIAQQVDDILHVVVVPYQNNIESSIKAGENNGVDAMHQYVARNMQTALMSLKGSKQRQFYLKKVPGEEWDGIVVYVETNDRVIQGLNIPLKKPG